MIVIFTWQEIQLDCAEVFWSHSNFPAKRAYVWFGGFLLCLLSRLFPVNDSESFYGLGKIGLTPPSVLTEKLIPCSM